MAMKLTKRAVDLLEPREARYDVYDTELPRFAVRVTPEGAKTFTLLYRAGSGRSAPTRRITLGRYGSLTVDQARQLARETLAAVLGGADPASERNRAKGAPTVGALGVDYLSDVDARRKPTTAGEYRRLWDKHVAPALGNKRVADVAPFEIARLHRSLGDTPYIANRVLALLGSFFAYAEGQGVRPRHTNPAHDVEPYKEQSRERFLTAEEVARLGEALTVAERLGLRPAPKQLRPKRPETAKHRPKSADKPIPANPFAIAAIRFLLLTGWREGEALTLKWSDVSLEHGRATLSDTKSGKSQRAIGAPARLLLNGLPRLKDCPFVFPGASPDRSLVDISRLWYAVRHAAELNDVRLHDLRHSFASVSASSGESLLVIGKLLGHRKAATTAKYAHLSDDPIRAAADSASGQLAAWLDGRVTVVKSLSRA
jgi:integrase